MPDNIKKTAKTEEIILLMTVFLLPLVFFPQAADPFWAVEKFMLKFCVSLLALAAGLKIGATGVIRRAGGRYLLLLAVFLLINVLGVFKAHNIYAFLDKFFINISYAVLFYAAALYTSHDEKNKEKLIFLIVFSSFLMAVYGIFQSVGIDFMPWSTDFSGRAASTLGNPNFLAGHMVLAAPVVYALLISASGKKSALILSAASIAVTMALLFSQTRGAYLAFAAEVFIFGVLAARFAPPASRGIKKTAAAVLVFLVLAGGAYFAFNKSIKERIVSAVTLKDEAAHIRISLWKNTMHMIKDNPLFGSGAGNFHIKYSYYQSSSLGPEMFENSDFYKSGHAHNDFIHACGEYGMLGAGIAVLIIIIFFRRLFLRIKEGGDKTRVYSGIAAGAAGMVIHGIFNFPFLIVPTAAWFFVFMGIEAGDSGAQEERPANSAKIKTAGIIAAAAAFVLTVVFVRLLASNVYLRKAKESGYFKRNADALRYASDAVRLNSWNEENHYTNAVFAAVSGAEGTALQSLREGYRLNPGHWEINDRLFSELMAKGMKEEALSVAENIYKISPYSKKAITYAGYAYFFNGKYDEAEKVYREGIKIKGGTYDLVYQLSAVYGASERPELALDYGEKAVKLSDNNAGALYNVAVAHYKLGNIKEAKKTIDILLEKFPGDNNAKGLKKVLENESMD